MDTKMCLWLSCLITLPAILLPFLVFIMKKICITLLAPSAPPSNLSLAPNSVPVPLNTCSLSTSPTAGGWDYEVFLSFRGEDTRKNFTDFLYCDLMGSGIHTFRDNNALRLGENIDEILKAIEQSKISIPVFSKDYASSEWCLFELTKMLECKKTRGQLIFPIFYDVKPSDVGEKTGSYRKAFREHKKNFDSATVKGWKKALKNVVELTGREVNNFADGHQGRLIKDVVLEVWRELKRNSLVVNECLVGIDNRVEEMMEFLSANSNDVRIVGIHGMPGIGKTTIAKVIYNQLSYDFDSFCFLADVRETAQQHNGLVDLQNQLISNILKRRCSEYSVNTMDEGINAIKNRLSGKKALVLVDDVHERIHLDALAIVGNCEWFGFGSRIIVTTRNKDILNLPEVDCRTYEPEELDSDQSLQLFSRHAFRRDHPPADYDSLSTDVVNTTGGLPLALEMIGSSLSGKGKDFWEGTLEQLKREPHGEVKNTLTISYKALEYKQQQIFLDIACLFIGVDRRIAFHMWEAYKFSPGKQIEILLLRSFVKIGDNNELRMHDQLRDFGRDIVYQENINNPEERSRVWFHEEAYEILNNHRGTRKIEALCVDFGLESQASYLKNEEFAGLSNLRFLQMDYANLDGDFERLLSKLQWLRWNGCPEIFRPTNFHLKNLIILDLSRSKVTEAWEGWNHIKIARRLKVLNLTGCSYMVRTPDFSAYATLERLILAECVRLVHIDPSIGYLKSLVFLDVRYCAKLNRLPPEIPEELKLVQCQNLHEIEGFKGLKSLKMLDLSYCKALERIPDLSKLEMLEELKLHYCQKLHEIEGLKGLKSLKMLDLSYCKALERIPDLSNLEMLEELKLHHCQKLHEIKGLKGLKALKMLDLSYCNALERIPDLSNSKMLEVTLYRCQKLHEIDGLKALKSLKILNLSYCTALERIPDLSDSEMLEELKLHHCQKLHEIEGLKGLKSLKMLDLSYCKALERLPDLPNSEMLEITPYQCQKLHKIEGLNALKSLKMMDLSNCTILERIPDLSNLEMLEELKLVQCHNLYEIEGLKGLKSLKMLDLSYCKVLERIPYLLKLEMLEELKLCECQKLHEIEGLKGLKSLKMLDLSSCKALERIPDLSKLEMLEELKLCDCQKLHKIEGLKGLKSLKRLDLSYCTALERIPDLSNSEMLVEFRLYDCQKLHEIVGVKGLKSLKMLDLSYCKALERIPDLSNSEMLEELKLHYCQKLHEIEGLKALKSLKMLNLSYCTALERIPDLSKLEMLEELKLHHCQKLHEIEGLKALKSLKMLDLSHCTALERIPDLSNSKILEELKLYDCQKLHEIEGLKGLKSLKRLDLSYCTTLERIPDLSRLTNLEELRLRNCQKIGELWGLEELKLLTLLDLSSCTALERIPDITRPQGELVKEGVSEVWGELERNSLVINENLVGIDDRVEMMKLLSVNSSDVRMVGIHGTERIGKTITAKVIYNQLSQHFEFCCFPADVRETARQHNGLLNLQNQLISTILKRRCSGISNVDEGIKVRISVKKVLVVSDDVDQRFHLHALAGKCDWFGSGSRIIVTTRNKDILNLSQVDCTYEPNELDSNQSLQLFRKHVFRRDHPTEDYDTLSRDVVSITGGLPLALEIIGSSLFGKGKKAWERTLKKLKRIANDKVQQMLRISYEALDNEQQQLFLDIACLFIGVDKRIAFHFWDDGNFYSGKAIDVLLLRSLVKIGDNNELKMHDQLRDFGRNIVRQENIKDPEERSRVWLHEEAYEILESHTGTRQVEAICVDFGLESQEYCLTNEEFADLSNLRFLQINYANLDGDFKGLLSKLRWLCWNGCPEIFRPTNFHLKNLAILDLSQSKVTEAWEGWNHIKIARKLKVLNLTGCSYMVRTPDFSAYETLERLILADCASLVHIDPSIGYLKSLVFLDVRYCAKLNRLPLEFDSLEALMELLIDSTSIQEVPIGRFLRYLSTSWCESLETLPDLSSLKYLRKLDTEQCKNLSEITGLERLESLEYLNMNGCISLERLPNLSNLKMLQELKLAECQKLHEIEGLEALKSLKMLDLSSCTGLERIPDLSRLINLKELRLCNCEKLSEIWGLEELNFLKFLDISGCKSLGKLPDISKIRIVQR